MTGKDKNPIRTYPLTNCKLCGSLGSNLHFGLRDALFGASGTWDYSRCTDPVCGLVWLNPAPEEADIGLAYQTYYTHGVITKAKVNKDKVFSLGLHILVTLTMLGSGLARQRQEAAHMYLGDQEVPGTLLEIGCGEGDFLHRMFVYGWRVVGLDFDKKAAQAAHEKYGVNVETGKLEEVAFPGETYDAVVMNHSLEHVVDPIGMLKEIHRILKIGGRIIIVTPNANSLGHQKFGRYWRGLEPPRHIQIFTQKALWQAVVAAGLTPVRSETTALNAWIILSASSLLARVKDQASMVGQKRPSAFDVLKAMKLQLEEATLNRWRNDIGEECILVARKDKRE